MKTLKIEIDKDDPKITSFFSKSDELLFGFDLKKYSPTSRFIILCCGLCVFYLIYGFMQEMIFRIDSIKPLGWYVTLVQFIYYTMFACFEGVLQLKEVRKVSLLVYMMFALLTVATMGLSNSSLGYLNYPTQVIFKCCKLIPVLIGGILIQGKKFHLLDWMACIFMSFGLAAFTLADSTLQPSFNFYGVFLISCALCADALIGNFQEKYMKKFKMSNHEMILYSYGIGVLYILMGQLLYGQLFSAVSITLSFPMHFYGCVFLFSLSGYIGVNFVLQLVKSYGALIAVTVTTCRKAVTMVLSFVLFPKPFTYQYIWSGLIVLFGIYLNIYSKNRISWNQKLNYLFRSLIAKHKKFPYTISEDV